MVWHKTVDTISLLTEARKHFAILALRHHVPSSWDCYLKEVKEKKHSCPIQKNYFVESLSVNYKTKERLESPVLCGLCNEASRVSNHLCVKKVHSINHIFSQPPVCLYLCGDDTMKCIHYRQNLGAEGKTTPPSK